MTVPMQKPILVMAGGTGGHVFPALAVAENLRQKGESVVWLGTRCGIEARVVPAADFAIEWLSVQGLRGKGLATLMLAPFRLLRACWQALRVLRRIKPKAVLGMGGFVAGPGGLMAWLLDIPLFLHEQNSIIGLTNRLLSRLATRNYFAFPDAAQAVPRSECIGNPVRAGFDGFDDPATRLQARLESPLQLLVIGGSLGAAALNRILPAAIACLDRDQRPMVRHQCGDKHIQACEQYYAAAGVDAEVVSFIDDMPAAYAWADLVVCRAGALTIAELGAAGVASLLIPFPYAVDNHQYHNARFLESRQAAQIFDEAGLSAESLALKLKFFQQNRPALVEMGVNARACFQADATESLASGILAGARS
ncbi:MAG: undecaprenyldiphospho-muramoylpentapeptide beta-N-acetylglucosaminyltransferase [Gammaproteobacteria bacterium]|nr:undecaprenyldiphospho-muramoylpentapeptide beta-N-acetylglucosaminyltransferase [Gammaproteobacteria bacterium]